MGTFEMLEGSRKVAWQSLLRVVGVFVLFASVLTFSQVSRASAAPPAFGTEDNPFTSLASAHGTPSGRYYFDLGSGAFQADIDDSEGGGWVLILQYVHAGGTNPDLNVIAVGADLPAMSTSVLGDDDSGDLIKWGHGGNAAISQFSAPTELRWQATTSVHNRVIHFSSPAGVTNPQTGTGSYLGVRNNHTLLTGHTATIPAAVDSSISSGDLSLTDFPYYRSTLNHWGVGAHGSRWEVDNIYGNPDTIHRVWVRAAATDTIAPVIGLEDSTAITVEYGAAFTDPGYSCVDDIDTSCTVVVGGDTVDPNTLGDYTITYDATDAAGNTAVRVTRTVSVVDTTAPQPPTVDPTDGTVVTGTAEPGSQVDIKDSTGTTVCTTTADGNGDFTCTPATAPTVGTVLTVTATDASTNTSTGTDTTVVAGFNTVTGNIYWDTDRDNTSGGEGDISGVDVKLMAPGPDGERGTTDDITVDTQTTASPYTFSNVANGDYQIVVDTTTTPNGVYPTGESTVDITVNNANVTTGGDLGFNYAQITGTFTDPQGNPIPNSTIVITDSAGNTFETTTDANGHFSIEGSSDQILALGTATITGTSDGKQITTTVEVVDGTTAVGALTTVGLTSSTATNQPATDRSTTNQPVANQPATGQPATGQPAKLALTGNQTRTHVAVALLLLVVGATLIATRRRYLRAAAS